MNTRLLVNLFLFIILLVFAGIFINQKKQPSETQRLTSLTLHEITQILIPRDQGKDILLQKSISSDNKPAWNLLKPYKIQAHQFRVNTLLGLSQTPVIKTYDISALDLRQYALDKPRASITFNNTIISFGKSNPINNKRYLMAEEKMVLLNDQIYPLVSSQPTTFVDLSLLPANSKINAVHTPEQKISKSNTGHWQSNSVNNLNADQIQNMLELWRNSQAFAVHAYMPRKQLGTIEIKMDNAIIKFDITDDDPWLILARPDLGIEYHLDNSLKNKLLGITEDVTDA